jgi:hypothetical protein
MAIAAAETLAVELRVDDELSDALNHWIRGLGRFGAAAESQSARASNAFAKLTNSARGFDSLLLKVTKGSAVLFGADLIARVAGFNSVMDVAGKASQAAADYIGFFASRVREGMNPALADANAQAREFYANLRKIEELKKSGVPQATFGLSPSPMPKSAADELKASLGKIAVESDKARRAQVAHAKEAAAEYAKLLQRVREWREEQRKLAALMRAAEGFVAPLVQLGAQVGVNVAQQREWNKHLRETRDMLLNQEQAERAIKPWADLATTFALIGAQAALSGKIIADTRKQLEAKGELERLIKGVHADLLEFGGDRAVAEQVRSGMAADELRARVEALGVAAGKTREEIDLYLARIDSWELQHRAAAAATGTFTGGIQKALASYKELSEQLGGQLVHGSVNALRTLGNDLAAGGDRAREAWDGFARNFLGNIADMISQMLAFKAIAGAFGAFGFDVPKLGGISAAQGGIFAGGLQGAHLQSYGPGGIAVGPQFARIGDNPAQVEAVVPLPGRNRGIPVEFRGGHGPATGSASYSLNLALTVVSLDPRGAAQVIEGALPELMPKIAHGFASMVQSGRVRNLNLAIRGA